MHQTIESLPQHLRKYTVEQDENRYSAKDQAAWRYIMRQSQAFFREHAVPIYLDGLRHTGITLERIPLISEMDAKLRRLGWGAVAVRGFIPPAAFLEFQARKILPIACDMRTVDHIAYTPAPDIVHEAAGHAPIIADPEYADYLTRYASMAMKAIFCREDLELYEAIRTLSDLKENPDSTPAMVAEAEASLARITAAQTFVSEASKVARMNWWTVEYGLLGSLERPKIYGAGLLSSVGESQSCLMPRVKKRRLSLDCVETSYDITEPQPQLFVAEDIAHLRQVLQEFEDTLAFKRGGLYGLAQGKQARTVTTTVLDSGLEISGQLDDYLTSGDAAEFLRYGGPVMLSHEAQALPDQGVAHHPQGFSTPLGRFAAHPDRPATRLSDDELARAGLQAGRQARLRLTSGFVVEGEVIERVRRDGKLLIIKWRQCRVTRGDQVYFQPEWGDFDMGIGERVVSVFGGPSDREHYGMHDVGQATTTPARKSPYTPAELRSFEAYAKIRSLRESLRGGAPLDEGDLVALAEELAADFEDEWLLRLESIELALASGARSPAMQKRLGLLMERLATGAKAQGEVVEWLVRQGLSLTGSAN